MPINVILEVKIMKNKKMNEEKKGSTSENAVDFLAETIEKSQKHNKEKNTSHKLIEKIYSLEKDIIFLQKSNIDLSEEIKTSTKYIKNYVRLKKIIALVKWTILFLVVVLGIHSFSYVSDYVNDVIGEVEQVVGDVLEIKNSI